MTELAAERMGREWAVRAAGGPFEVLKKYPEALRTLDVARATELARPACQKVGLELARWPTGEAARRLPLARGVKYLAVEGVAAVGAYSFFHMDGHLASRDARIETLEP
jgi:hypothetical protein